VAAVDEASDEALVALVALGDQQAFASLVRRLQGPVYGLARRVLDGDRARAEEVAQEAFVRIWRHAASYDVRRGSVRAWALTIARNLAIDARRLRRDQPVAPGHLPETEAALAGCTPEDWGALVDQRDRVRAELARLPAEQRRALVLVAWWGRTAQEVADIEGIPLGTAKTRIRSGLRRLRVRLGPEASPPGGALAEGSAEGGGRRSGPWGGEERGGTARA
jgi:RNA polymerase sigma-70 factor (ECF subfamily)